MKLMQKMSVGLGMACLMMMSSCSKEEAVTPEPKMEVVKGDESMRNYAPYLAPTDSIEAWEKYYPKPEGNFGYWPTQIGSSSLTHLWNDMFKQFVKPMQKMPQFPNMNSVLTISGFVNAGGSCDVAAKTTIKNLVKGKRYSITYYYAAAIPDPYSLNLGLAPVPAEESIVDLEFPNGSHTVTKAPLMTIAPNKWIQNTITFKAQADQATLTLKGDPNRSPSLSGGVFDPSAQSYIHYYIGQGAIKTLPDFL